ncbi:uncharacterized protein EAF01_010068 [Botrytis porri]|uniref:uncharacterized protein n=1 Tax=Botrytis porri TaxID=87229 RepID=UPI0018FF625B|nr:uncharacterized protein EAF01_010068 [Botrytis porri]KAF7894618.1 hypothetical protein EAF01_010068 [Botrytis porri]
MTHKYPDKELSQIIKELQEDIPSFLESPKFTRNEIEFIHAMNGVVNHGEEYFESPPTKSVPYPQAPRGGAAVKVVLFVTGFLILVIWLALASFCLLVYGAVGDVGAGEGGGDFWGFFQRLEEWL